jgi:hypothetical protein
VDSVDPQSLKSFVARKPEIWPVSHPKLKRPEAISRPDLPRLTLDHPIETGIAMKKECMLRNGTCDSSSYWPFSVIESSVGELVRGPSALGKAAAFFPLKNP